MIEVLERILLMAQATNDKTVVGVFEELQRRGPRSP